MPETPPFNSATSAAQIAIGDPPAGDPTPPAALGSLPFRRRFHIRLSALYGGLIFLIVALLAVAFYAWSSNIVINGLKSRVAIAAIALSHLIEVETVLSLRTPDDYNSPAHQQLIERFRQISEEEPEYVSIYILRPTGRPGILAFVTDYVRPGRPAEAAKIGEEYDTAQSPDMLAAFHGLVSPEDITSDKWGPTISAYAPIRDAAGRSIAIVGVDASGEEVTLLRGNILKLTLLVFVIAALFVAFIAWRVGRHIRQPLNAVTEAADAIAAGKLETVVDLRRDDEFGLLGRHVNFMAAGLREREFIRATFGRYMSESVARRVLATRDGSTLGGEERAVTVILTDLAGYSTASEMLTPPEIVSVLNAYFGEMGALIERHEGCIVGYLGDGILAVFSAPLTVDRHAELAVRCGVAMRARLAELNHEWEQSGFARIWRSKGVPALRMRIGIHSGSVVAGNIGSPSRVTYTMIGDTVNVAARLEQLNKETQTEILFSSQTHALLPAELQALARTCGIHRVKGRMQDVAVYTV